jgi:hypothetical protein
MAKMFKRLDIDQECKLESQVIKDPEALEDGLVYLTHQRPANGNYIDVLAVDSDGVLIVIELKVGEDDEMLLQALEYYDYVSSNRDRLAKEYEAKAKIVAQEEPRIMLVASSFTDRLRLAARYVEPKVTLLEYAYLETKSKEHGLFCKEVRFESEGGYSAPVALEAIFAYVVNPGVKKACLKVHSDIMTLGQDLEAVATNYHGIKYKCNGRLVGGLALRRTFFYVWYRKNEDWPEFKLTAISDWIPKKEKALKAMDTHYREFGGEERD